MATAQEKQALGLPADATEEAVEEKIRELTEAASVGAEDASELERERALREDAESKIASEVEAREAAERRAASAELDAADAAGAADELGDEDSTREVKIAHKVFSYRVLGEHPVEPGKRVYLERLARRGDTIRVLPDDYARGAQFGAFVRPGQAVERNQPTRPDVPEATDTELIVWIKDGSPTAQEIVDASEGDADNAQRLLTAEAAATGNDSRRAVVVGLNEVISRASQE